MPARGPTKKERDQLNRAQAGTETNRPCAALEHPFGRALDPSRAARARCDARAAWRGWTGLFAHQAKLNRVPPELNASHATTFVACRRSAPSSNGLALSWILVRVGMP